MTNKTTIMRFVILISIIFGKTSVGSKLSPRFVANYFEDKFITQIAIFSCWDDTDVLTYVKDMGISDMKVSYTRIKNGLSIEKILKVNYYKLGLVLDLDCIGSNVIFEQFSAARLPFNVSYFWLAATYASEVPTDMLRSLPLTVSTEFTVTLVNESNYLLYDVYNPSYRHGAQINVTYMGYWNEDEGLKNFLQQYKYKRRQNFNRLTFNFSTLFLEPNPDLNLYLNTQLNPHLDSMNRYHYNLAKEVQKYYNLSMNLKIDKTWGYLINGTFGGVIGDFIKGTCDISGVAFYFKQERITNMDFTVPTYVVKATYLFRHPRQNDLKNPFLKPFTQDVWWVTLNLSIVIWILLLVSIKIEQRYYSGRNPAMELYDRAMSETALTTVAALSLQGLSRTMNLYSGRIVFFTLFMWGLMMSQFYSASIVGSLLSEAPKFINTPYELADSNLDMGLEDVPYVHDWFRLTTEPESRYVFKKKLADKKTKPELYTNAARGMEKVSKGGYSFYVNVDNGYKIIEDTFSMEAICDLHEIPLIKPQHVTLGTAKKSPLTKMVTYSIAQMLERGIVKRMKGIWQPRRPTCPESFRSKPVPVELKEFLPAIFIVIGGLVLATILMVSEHLYNKINFTKNRIIFLQK